MLSPWFTWKRKKLNPESWLMSPDKQDSCQLSCSVWVLMNWACYSHSHIPVVFHSHVAWTVLISLSSLIRKGKPWCWRDGQIVVLLRVKAPGCLVLKLWNLPFSSCWRNSARYECNGKQNIIILLWVRTSRKSAGLSSPEMQMLCLTIWIFFLNGDNLNICVAETLWATPVLVLQTLQLV